MSNVMLNRVWRLRNRLRSTERLVLLALADRCNGSGMCWPGLTDLAQRTGLGLRDVRKVLRRLERQKLVVTHPRRGRTSRYHLLLNDPASKVNTPEQAPRGGGQSSAANTPDRQPPHPGTPAPPNPQEPSDGRHRDETYGSTTRGAGAGSRKIAARRRWTPGARGSEGRP